MGRNHLRPSDLVRQLLLVLELKLTNPNMSAQERKCPCEIVSNGLYHLDPFFAVSLEVLQRRHAQQKNEEFHEG